MGEGAGGGLPQSALGPQIPEEAALKAAASALLALLLALPLPVVAKERLDWEPDEAPAGPLLTWVRGVRDGTLGFFDDASDLQLGIFSEASLTLATVVMAASDLVGLVDDNPVTEHVLKGTFSKSLARPAYLLHLAGAEAILGSHGLETEWYVEAALTDLNPLLDEESGPSIPLSPLAFVGEGTFHSEVYAARIPGSILAASVVGNVLIRPPGNVLRILGFHGAADRAESLATSIARRAAW